MIERIEINLLPAEYRIHTKRIFLQREIVYPVLFIAGLFITLSSFAYSYDIKISEYNNGIQEIDFKIKKNQHIPMEIKKLQKHQDLIQNKIKALELIDVNREKWIRLQEVFCKTLPGFTWIEKIEERKGSSKKIEIEGKTFSLSEVASFMSMLLQSEFVNEIDLKKIEQTNSEELVYSFVFVCSLNSSVIENNVSTTIEKS